MRAARLLQADLPRLWRKNLKNFAEPSEKIKNVFQHMGDARSENYPLKLLEVFLEVLNEYPKDSLRIIHELNPSKEMNMEKLNYKISKSCIKLNRELLPEIFPLWLNDFKMDKKDLEKLENDFEKYRARKNPAKQEEKVNEEEQRQIVEVSKEEIKEEKAEVEIYQQKPKESKNPSSKVAIDKNDKNANAKIRNIAGWQAPKGFSK
jgi:hypothetical protein